MELRLKDSRPEDRLATAVFVAALFHGLVILGLKFSAPTSDDRPLPTLEVLLVPDGEPVPYALARIPSASDNRGNLAAGAKGVGRPLDDRDRWLAGRIGPVLRERGMLFVGLDVIGGFVTEINVTSPTGVRELDRQFGLDIAGQLMDAIAARRGA